MPKFQDSEPRINIVPEGDYKFTVIEFDSKIATGAKTAGSPQYEAKLQIESKFGKSLCWENLIDHPKTIFKLDAFLKCAGITLTKGEAYEFDEELAKQNGVRWINPLGLRGWCRLYVDKYNGKDKNAVATFYVDKEKLPQVEIKSDEPEEENTPF